MTVLTQDELIKKMTKLDILNLIKEKNNLKKIVKDNFYSLKSFNYILKKKKTLA